MAYETFTTKGLVLGAIPLGENNLLISIFTERFGRIYASAQGVRLESSKLRSHLEEFSEGNFSVVRGKKSWKITGAKKDNNFFRLFRGKKNKKILSAKIFLLLKVLLHGEEANQRLYFLTQEALNFLKDKEISDNFEDTFEALVALRFLYELGYIDSSEWISGFVDRPLDEGLIVKAKPFNKKLINVVNSGINQAV